MNYSTFGAIPTQFPLSSQIEAAAESIRARINGEGVSVCLILGSGMGSLADRVESAVEVPYREIPGFPLSHVAGHAGKLVIGTISGVCVAALSGRAHLYEGWTAPQSTFPLRVIHALGARTLFVSNASGGINPRFRSGQVVLIDQHIDAMRRNPFAPSELSGLESHHRDVSDHNRLESTADIDARQINTEMHRRGRAVYDAQLMEIATRHAIELGFALHRGTYLATLGPSYETRAEYRAFEMLGADMVGMSTVPEVLVANQLGMRTLAFSIITNVAKPDAPTKTDHSEVLDWSRQAQQQLIPLIEKILPDCVD